MQNTSHLIKGLPYGQACAKGQNIELILLLEFTLGLCLGELCELRWKDVDLDRGTVCICNTRINAGNKVIEKSFKTAEESSTVVLGEKLVASLREYKAGALGEYVVAKSDGAPYSPSSITRKVRRFQKKYSLPAASVHKMRHTNTSLLCESGVDPVTVKEQLGHSDISTTLGIYTHVTKTMEQRVLKRSMI